MQSALLLLLSPLVTNLAAQPASPERSSAQLRSELIYVASGQDAGQDVLLAEGTRKSRKASKKKKAAPADASSEEATTTTDSTTSASASGRGASWDNRARKRFSVLAEMGFVEFPQFGFGLRGNLISSPSFIYDFGYSHSNFEWLGIRYTSDIMSGRVKWFTGNSFYLTGGLAYRKMEGEVSEFLFGSDTLARYNNTSLLLDFAIGNHWQFSSLTLGCDWVGFFQPLVKLSESAEDTKTSSSTSTEDNAGSFRSHAKAGTLQLVRFYLGWSF